MGFNSFGGDFSAGIHDWLKERRETKRQAMLDALRKREVESQMEIARENMLSSKMQREALAQQYQQNALEDYIKNAGLTADMEMTPEQVAEVESKGGKGMIYEGVKPNVQTQEQYFGTPDNPSMDAEGRKQFAEEAANPLAFKPEGPLPPTMIKKFRGTLAERQEMDRSHKLAEIMNSIKDPNMDPISKILMIRMADPKLAESMDNSLLNPSLNEPYRFLDQDKGEIVTPTDPVTGKPYTAGSVKGTRSRAPSANMMPVAVPGMGTEQSPAAFRVSDGKGNVWLVDGKGNFISNVTGQHTPTGAESEEPVELRRNAPQKTDAARAKQVQAGEREAKKQATWKSAVPVFGKKDAESNARVIDAAKEAIADTEMDPFSAQEIFESYKKAGLLTDADKKAFVEAMTKSRGR